jgi:hypothetical protein
MQKYMRIHRAFDPRLANTYTHDRQAPKSVADSVAIADNKARV